MTQIRKTKQKEIIKELYQKQKGFFTAEDLFNQINKKDKTIGIATIYRFLKELKRKNQVFAYICDRKTLYSKEKRSHCHYICEKTGKITHFELSNLDFLKTIKKQIPGKITSFQLEVKGLCENCKSNL